ncbi:MAG: hypothetical protein RJA70_2527 [Pseudomonadota bacterium]
MDKPGVYDLLVVGTGFASSFFLRAYLEKVGPEARVLVLERGRHDTHAWQIQNRVNTSLWSLETYLDRGSHKKPWVHTLGFGGGSNCWWAVTPRFLPSDFRMGSTYGVGVDWPLSYDDLEPHYARAEEWMSISGPSDDSPFPRSGPYPQPPHRLTDPDRLMKAAFPDQFFVSPTARARISTPTRPACCATGNCHLCPVNAKFTVQNSLQSVYDDPRVTLRLEASVQAVEVAAGLATGVSYKIGEHEHLAHAELIALGANALFNPHILLRSGFDDPGLGQFLDEQVALGVTVELDGVENFQGSTSITGHGYMLYDGEHRRENSGCLMESWNVPTLRIERKRWRQILRLKFIFENLAEATNQVRYDPTEPDKPVVVYAGDSEYAKRGMRMLEARLPEILKSLPVERYRFDDGTNGTEAHMLGTTIMGNDPNTSVVDRYLVHHKVRNLLVLGGGAFPTMSPSNPTLTLSALSLWAAEHLMA